jgi:hypothetical protein
MKTGKALGGLAVIVLLAVVIGGYLLVSNLDGIIKGVIEDVGSDLTQTKVTLDGVKLDLTTGKGQLSGLTIANPRGFDSDYAFRLEDITIALDLKTLSGPVIVISEVSIEGAKLNAEQKGETTNLGVLMENVEKSSKKANKTQVDAPDKTDPADVRLMLEKFVFVNTQGKIITEQSGEKALKLPDVRRNNIGNKTTGLTPEQLADELLQSVMKQVQKAVESYLADMAKDAIEDSIKEKMGLSDGDDTEKSGLKSLFNKKD